VEAARLLYRQCRYTYYIDINDKRNKSPMAMWVSPAAAAAAAASKQLERRLAYTALACA